MSTKTVKGDQCIVCSTKFHSRNKALQRTNVFTTIRRRNFTLSDALKLLDVIVSPLKVQQKFCCSSCTIKVRDLYDANQSVTKNRRNIEDVVSPDSYVSSKKLNSNECEFSTPRKGIKRLVDSGFVLPKKRIINPSPPAATHSVYNKRTNKRGNKVGNTVLKSKIEVMLYLRHYIIYFCTEKYSLIIKGVHKYFSFTILFFHGILSSDHSCFEIVIQDMSAH